MELSIENMAERCKRNKRNSADLLAEPQLDMGNDKWTSVGTAGVLGGKQMSRCASALHSTSLSVDPSWVYHLYTEGLCYRFWDLFCPHMDISCRLLTLEDGVDY